ncbi:hypothetical protein [Paenisporosarcina sp. NPDC076898]
MVVKIDVDVGIIGVDVGKIGVHVVKTSFRVFFVSVNPRLHQ